MSVEINYNFFPMLPARYTDTTLNIVIWGPSSKICLSAIGSSGLNKPYLCGALTGGLTNNIILLIV